MTKTNLSTNPDIQQTQGGDLRQSGAFRYGAIMPLAAVLTLGLTLTMAGLIATEFTPQQKMETATFEINPKVQEIQDPERTITIDPLQEVEVPPPPPALATVQTAAVDLPIVEVLGKKIEFDLGDLDFGNSFENVIIDQEVKPIVRIPPIFPNRFLQGDVSGYCDVQFDISAEGKPFNVSATLCTNDQLKAPTVKSVLKWNYAPEMRDGQSVSRTGLKTTIRFDLQDERGRLLPLPAGY